MIKAVIKNGDDENIGVIIGLSGENMTRLMNKEPIRFNLKEMGLPDLTVVIVGGKDENVIVKDLKNTWGPKFSAAEKRFAEKEYDQCFGTSPRNDEN